MTETTICLGFSVMFALMQLCFYIKYSWACWYSWSLWESWHHCRTKQLIWFSMDSLDFIWRKGKDYEFYFSITVHYNCHRYTIMHAMHYHITVVIIIVRGRLGATGVVTCKFLPTTEENISPDGLPIFNLLKTLQNMAKIADLQAENRSRWSIMLWTLKQY